MWSDEFRDLLTHLFRLRRDVRSFCTTPLPDGSLQRWIESACLAPSVGYSQPWRFVSIRSPEVRSTVAREFESQNNLCAETYDEHTAAEYRRLKLSGLDAAPEQLAIFVDPDPQRGRGLGRATMPETVVYSVVAAIQNLWLAARAEGVGVGWVSILQPESINAIVDVPREWQLVAYLCIGYPKKDSVDSPELEQLGWETRVDLESIWLKR
jgi:5,6-dimethylbenzimidazole synthase